jgi:peptidoglycan biosynthesis protein MviN/MurJ (putative lipid II flippase)
MILAPAFYARANYSTPTRSSLISVAVNLCMNYVLVACLGYGAWSVAAATSLASLCNALLLLWAFRRDLGVSPLPPLRSLLRPITFAFFASAVCLLLLAGIFPAQLPSLIWQGGVIERRLSMQLLGCGSITLLYGCIYLAGVRKQLLA